MILTDRRDCSVRTEGYVELLVPSHWNSDVEVDNKLVALVIGRRSYREEHTEVNVLRHDTGLNIRGKNYK